MSVNCVYLEADAYLVCLTHALSTEREEIMGLLIGDVDEERVSRISAVIMLRRSDKQSKLYNIDTSWFSSYLNKRFQQTHYAGAISDKKEVISVVPQ